jgi:hypothetical protein
MSDDRNAELEDRARFDAAAGLVRERLERELRQATENLSATHARCTELLMELRVYKLAAELDAEHVDLSGEQVPFQHWFDESKRRLETP